MESTINKLFDSKNRKFEILSYQRAYSWDDNVIDHESIVGRKGSKDILELIVIYEVKNEKIIKMTVLK